MKTQTGNIETIIAKIKETTKERMNVWEIDFFNHIKGLERYCQVDVYKENKGASCYKISAMKSAKGYTKSMERFFGRAEKDLESLISKVAFDKLEKIDIAVHKKLSDVDIKTVEMVHFNADSITGHSEGSWLINGDIKFGFRSIYAGGYNIQCEHVRTLYSRKG